jgi:hypothetical protein
VKRRSRSSFAFWLINCESLRHCLSILAYDARECATRLQAWRSHFRTYVFNDVEIDSCGVGKYGIDRRMESKNPKACLRFIWMGARSCPARSAWPMGLAATRYVEISGADGSETETAVINSWSVTPGITPAITPLPFSIWLTLVGLRFTGFGSVSVPAATTASSGRGSERGFTLRQFELHR